MAPSLFLKTLATAALFATLAPAQTPQTKSVQVETSPAAKDPEYVITKDFRTKVFIVQHSSPFQLQGILAPLGSGFRGATIRASDGDGLRTLSVRDFPENLATIEEALKRLDVPIPTAKEAEFQIHVLFASKQESPDEGIPEALRGVLTSLRFTLAFRSFSLATSFVQRGSAGKGVFGQGQAELTSKVLKGENPVSYVEIRWQTGDLKINAPAEGPASLHLNGFSLRVRDRNGNQLAAIQTELNLKDGENVVVGTSTLKDRGLIVVVTGKVLK